MNVIQQYLDANNITRYKVSKLSGISQPTLKAAADSKNGIDGLTGKVIKAMAVALNKTPGDVLNELINLEESTMAFNEDHTFTILTTIWNKNDSIFSDESYEYDEFSEACAAFDDLIKKNRIDEKITFDLFVDDSIVMSATLADNEMTDSYTDNLEVLSDDVKPTLLAVAKAHGIK